MIVNLQDRISKELLSLSEEELQESIFIESSGTLYQQDQSCLSKKDIIRRKATTSEELIEMAECDNCCYGTMFLEELCFRLPNNKTIIFKDNELITAGIIEIKDMFPQKPNGSYAEVGITWGCSDKPEFEVSTINDFNISLLKIEIGRYSVLRCKSSYR